MPAVCKLKRQWFISFLNCKFLTVTIVFVIKVTSKKAALIETNSQLRNKLGETATISRGNLC